MSTELSLSLIHSQLPERQRLLIDEGTVEEIRKLAEDPEYGPEFIESYIDHLNIFKENPKQGHSHYLRAVKFFSLVEAGNSLTDAYIKTFPDRWEARRKNHPEAEHADKTFMRGEASRYNSTKMVNEIRRVAAIPVHLIHRHLLHEAILIQAGLMLNGKSEFVKQKAAEVLIKELKPAEDAIEIKVDDKATSIIGELSRITKALAAEQYKKVEEGMPLKEIAGVRLITSSDDEEIIEDEDV